MIDICMSIFIVIVINITFGLVWKYSSELLKTFEDVGSEIFRKLITVVIFAFDILISSGIVCDILKKLG